jgi:hypothetical protein
MKITLLLGLSLCFGVNSYAADCLHDTNLEGVYGFDITLGTRRFLDLVHINQACVQNLTNTANEGQAKGVPFTCFKFSRDARYQQ